MECPNCGIEMTTYHNKEIFRCNCCNKVIVWGSDEDLKLNHGILHPEVNR